VTVLEDHPTKIFLQTTAGITICWFRSAARKRFAYRSLRGQLSAILPRCRRFPKRAPILELVFGQVVAFITVKSRVGCEMVGIADGIHFCARMNHANLGTGCFNNDGRRHLGIANIYVMLYSNNFKDCRIIWVHRVLGFT